VLLITAHIPTILGKLLNDLIRNCDGGKHIILVSCDYSRAIDRINCELLLAKLQCYG
jgi:hypothetical protein